MNEYLLVYSDSKGEKRAAVPNVEGVYTNSIPFEEYSDALKNNEVAILSIKDLTAAINDESVDDVEAEVVGKFVGSEKIEDCIKELGFDKFFTSLITKYMEEEGEILKIDEDSSS